jgi:hypothetical protein
MSFNSGIPFTVVSTIRDMLMLTESAARHRAEDEPNHAKPRALDGDGSNGAESRETSMDVWDRIAELDASMARSAARQAAKAAAKAEVARLGANAPVAESVAVAEPADSAAVSPAMEARAEAEVVQPFAQAPAAEPVAQAPAAEPVAQAVAAEPIAQIEAAEPEATSDSAVRSEVEPFRIDRDVITRNGASAEAAPDSNRATTPPADETMSQALRIIAEQRKAAEALLLEACALEDRLKSEAKLTGAASEYAAAREKAESAALAEQEAHHLAQASSEHHAAVATERRDLEALIAAEHAETEAFLAQIAQLEQQLKETQESAEQMFRALELHEALAKECLEKEAVAGHEAAEATARVVACQAERVAAEKEAVVARERADALKKALPATAGARIDEVHTLAARIAEQTVRSASTVSGR